MTFQDGPYMLNPEGCLFVMKHAYVLVAEGYHHSSAAPHWLVKDSARLLEKRNASVERLDQMLWDMGEFILVFDSESDE